MVKTIKFQASQLDTNAGNNTLLKPVHGVNGSPKSLAPGFPDLDDQFNQMGITYIRMHDGYGVGDLDNRHQPNRTNNQDQFILNVPDNQKTQAKTLIAQIANKRAIFPNASNGMKNNSLEQALSNANYASTDAYFRDILTNQANLNPGNIQRDIMFRLGRSLDGGYELPENIDIYVSLIGELMKRYSKNYASIGLPRKIIYWELWNEPDLTFFWNSNDPKKYYDFYAKVARLAKSIDPDIKIGGSGVANGYNPGGAYTDQFLSYCQNNNVPIDFYSWHLYGNITADPQSIIDAGNQVQESLNNNGFGNIESICSEWNISPFSTKNVHSKTQSAKNAAFISSYFMGMQYTKVDKAYYYRADAASFGLFNDQDNSEIPGRKNFCTCAAQSFNLFSRMFETPYILASDKDFSSGIMALAGKNQSGSKINVLVSNYKVDPDFPKGDVPPKESILYQQHFLDTNRTIEQLNDNWSKDHWFGGSDPNTLYPQNDQTQKNPVQQLPVYAQLRAKPRNYTESDQGVELKIQNIDFTGVKITAYRIQEGKGLNQMTPPEVSSQIKFTLTNGTLNIIDSGAKPSTVTFYTIEQGTEKPTPPDNTITKEFTIDRRGKKGCRYSFGALLPDDYNFQYGKKYRLEIEKKDATILTCLIGSFLEGTCTTSRKKEYTYENEIFTPYFNGMRNNPLIGNKNILVQANQYGVIKIKLTPL